MVNLGDLRRLVSFIDPMVDRAPIEPPPGSWPAGDPAPRVLVEHQDPVWRWAAARRLEAAGYQVTTCGGPGVFRHGRCPLVAGEGCPAVDGADVVVNGLGIRDAGARAVLSAVRGARPELPVVVELPQPQSDDLDAAIPGCRVVPFPVGPVELVRAVEEALTR